MPRSVSTEMEHMSAWGDMREQVLQLRYFCSKLNNGGIKWLAGCPLNSAWRRVSSVTPSAAD